MNIRTIKIYTTLGVSAPIETNVTTLGELRPLLRAKGIEDDGMKLLVGETRNELSVDEAILPEGDFKLYLMPQKTKSGTSKYAMLEKICGLFNDLADAFGELADEEQSSYTPAKGPSPVMDEDEQAMRDLASLNGRG